MQLRREQDRRGATLILVVILGGLLAALAIGTAAQADRVADAEAAQGGTSQLTYQVEAAAEALRLEVVRHYETAGLSSGQWLSLLRDDLADGTAAWPGTAPPGSPSDGGDRTYPSLEGVRAWIDAAPADQSYIEIVAATTEAGEASADQRAPVSVRMRVNIGQNEIFDLAMLTETTNCMFCHFHINGDVGSIGFFRPGWGSENGGGRRSGSGSEIAGDIFIGTKEVGGRTGPSDDSDTNWRNDVLEDPTEVNGTDITGDLFEDYSGSKLPEDTIGNDGVPDFPSFDPAEVTARAQSEGGTVWAGNATNDAGDGSGTWVVPHGSDWSSGRVTPAQTDFQPGGAYQSVIDGNLVLKGTPDNPIQLDGNVFVTGDVVIEGTVEGQGAIYAGRNVYVTGNIDYADEPSSGFPLTDDSQGRAAVGESTSELRLAARSNVVVGDWTYREDDGDISPVRDRQGQDFMKAQFDLNAVRYFKEGTTSGDVAVELTESGGRYFDDLGNEVPASDVVVSSSSTYEGSHQGFRTERFDAVMAPGNVVDDGSGNAEFVPWISQQEFRDDLLGREKYDIVQWRLNRPPPSEIEDELGSEWVDHPDDPGHKDYVEELKTNSDGSKSGMFMKWGGHTKIAETNVEWTTQVTHIDAFLFANKRIGGKSDIGKLTVNGGMAAREIGVLAPGYRNLAGIHLVNSGSPDQIPSWVWDSLANDTNKYGERTHKMRLHYDYRLRNGGFGFEFFAKTGDLLLYRRGGAAEPPF